MMYLKITFSFFLLVPSFAFAGGATKPPINTCQDYKNISKYCAGNGLFGMMKNNDLLASLKAKDQKSGQLGKTAQANGTENIQLSEQIEMDCASAGQTCKDVCTKYTDQEKNLVEQLSKIPAPNTPVQQIQDHKDNIEEAKKAMEYCATEVEKGSAKAGQSKMNGNQLLMAALALLDRLGLGDGAGSASDIPGLSNDEATDPCDGPLAATMVSCVNKSASDDSRRSSGTTTGTSPRGALGNGALGVAGGDDTDGIGGEKKEAGNDGSFGGSFGGGLGIAGLPGGSGGGGSENGGEVKSLDQKIAEGGYLSGGASGGSGGGGSGGLGGMGASSFAATGGAGGVGVNPALNNKLNKLKASASSKRAPASAGANGPFADLWSVVNKSYKKNKSTLFHQK